jgi:hypothetical protein
MLPTAICSYGLQAATGQSARSKQKAREPLLGSAVAGEAEILVCDPVLQKVAHFGRVAFALESVCFHYTASHKEGENKHEPHVLVTPFGGWRCRFACVKPCAAYGWSR